MPSGTIALGGLISSLLTGTAAVGGTAFAIGLAAQTAIGLALYAISGASKLSNQSQGYTVTTTSAAAEHQIVYGETRVGGVRVFDATTGSNNKYLHRVLAFTGHEIEAFKEIYIGEYKVTSFSGTSGDGFGEGNVLATNDPDFSDRYDGFIEVYKHYGTSDQVADPLLVSRVGDDPDAPEWGADHRLRGVSYLYIQFKYDPDVFPNGVPEVTAVIRGKKVFDPRTGTTTWSSNPALCVRDYLTATGYGLGETTVNVDDTRIAAAADICDEDVTYLVDGVSTTVTRYTCNGSFLTSAQPVDVLQTMLTSCAGLLWYAQGQWRLKPGYYQTPTLTLTDDDARSGYKVSTRNSRRDTFNGVTGTFRGEESDWQTTDYPPVKSAAAITADGGQESLTDLNLPFTSTSTEARRLALIALEQNRQQITVQADFSLRAFNLQVGDVVNLTIPRFGWDTKPFEVIGWGFQVDTDLTIPVNMTLRETASTIYDTVDDTAVYEGDNTNLASPFITQTPNSLTATLDKSVQADGSTLIAIDFAWSVTDPTAVAYYEFEWKLSTASDYNSVVVNETQWELTGAKNNVTYEFRVRSVNQLGIKSPYANGSIATGVDTSVPKAPTAVTVDGNYRMCRVSWTAPTQNTDDTAILDLYQHKVYRGTTAGFVTNDATNLIGTVSGTVLSDTGLADATTYFYKVRAVDFTGNVSAASTAGSGTTDAAVSNEIAEAIENSTAVQTVNTNTATGSYDGQIVLSSVDGNLYIWDEATGEWIRAVESVDLTGAVDVAAFADGIEPVQVIDVLPSSGTVGETVYLTTDGKLYTWNGTEWTAEVQAVDIVGTITESQIADEAITVAKFAAGLTPVEIVDALPATGNYAGRQVFLTTDSKLYRHTGSPLDASGWTVEVDGADILANSITAGQIEAGAIGATEIAAGAITASKLAVTDLTNYIQTPLWQTSQTLEWDIGIGHTIAARDTGSATAALATMPLPYAIRAATVPGSITSEYLVPEFTVSPDEKFRVAFSAAGAGASISRYWQFRWVCEDVDGTEVFASYVNFTVTGTAWVEGEVEIGLPATATKVTGFVLRSQGTSDGGSSNDIYITNLVVQKKNAGQLIVDGSITANLIEAGTITGDKIAANTIEGDNIAGNTITGDKIVANTITSGLIQAGTIGADQIAANAITTEKLAIGDFSSAVTNYTFSNAGEGWIDGAGDTISASSDFAIVAADSASGVTAIATMPTPQALRAEVAASEIYADFPMSSPVVPGKELLLSVDYAGVGTSISRTWRAQVYFRDAEGAFLSANTNDITVTSTSWATDTHKITVPTAAATIYLVRLRALAGGSSNQIYATNVKLQQITDGVLIADGAIDANKIVVGGIDAQDIIANGTITAAQIDAAGIDAVDIIATGTITSSLINVSQLSAISATIGTLRTATTGERVEIKDNQIVVYDSSGTAVVVIGDLTGF